MNTQEKIYKELQKITENIPFRSGKLLAISNWINDEFEVKRKPYVLGPRKTERVSSKIRAQLMPYLSLVERYKAGHDIGQFIELIEKNQSELLSLIDETAEFELFWLESMVVNKDEVQTVDEFLNQEIK